MAKAKVEIHECTDNLVTALAKKHGVSKQSILEQALLWYMKHRPVGAN